MNATTLVMSTESYRYLQDGVCAAGGFDAGAVERRRFPDGERYQRLDCDVRDADVVLIGGTISDADTLELYDLACTAVNDGARRLTLVIPYFGYSTMERAERPGEVVTAKTRARLLSSVPTASMGNRVLLVDLHAAGIAHYFEGPVWPLALSARPLIEATARRLGGATFVLGCTDAGRAKWVESLAHGLGVVPAFVYKRRLSGGKTAVTGVSAHVRGQPVVIYDDMIRTGSSLLGAARAYHDAGATRVSAITTHGLFPGDALDRIHASGLLDTVVATDTHPRARQLAGPRLEVLEIAPLLADTLRERT